MADIPPRIAFIRSKISLAAMMTELNDASAVSRVRVDNAITGKDTVVMPLPVAIDQIDASQFDYFEVLALSPMMVPATSVEAIYEDEDGNPSWFGEEARPSTFLEKRLTWNVSTFERPSFGRRMLLVNYEIDQDERDLERAKGRIRRALGNPTAVWQGRTFEAYCFVDNAAPELIMKPLYTLLDRDEDYLLVQPTDMVLADKSGLSRLEDWMEVGYRQHRPRLEGGARRASRKPVKARAD